MARTLAAALVLASLASGMERPVSRPADIQQSPLTNGSISGRVAIERPRQMLSDVRAFRVWTTSSGERTLGGPPGGVQAETDGNTGEYTIRNLPAGDYVIAAIAFDATTINLAQSRGVPQLLSRTSPTFYPAAIELAAAEIVRVTAGADVRGIDISLVSRQWSTIEGRVVDPSGQPSPFAQVEITVASIPGALRPMLGLQRMKPVAEGSFVFMVPPGRYVIAARGSGIAIEGSASTSRRLTGQADITVTGFDVNNVVLRLDEGAKVSGKLTVVGSTMPAPDFEHIYVRLIPYGAEPATAATSIWPAALSTDGTFTIDGIAPGRYSLTALLTPSLANRWWVEDAIAGGRDTRDFPLEIRARESVTGAVITLTDRRTELSCTVQDSTGAPTSAYAVAIVPADPALRSAGSPRMPKPGRPSATDGRHVVSGLPPGDYLIFALTDVDDHAWAAGIWPEFDAASAVKMSLMSGEKRAVTVRVK